MKLQQWQSKPCQLINPNLGKAFKQILKKVNKQVRERMKLQ